MNKKIKLIARQKVGQYLASIREESGITKYEINKKFKIPYDAIKAIEEGSSNYTIDNFLMYIQAVDCYFYLTKRDGKHLDMWDLIEKSSPPDEENNN